MHFLGDYISAHRRCCALKFWHALEIDQALLPRTPRWDRVPQKILIVKIKIWPKIQRFKVNDFRATGIILTGLFSVDVARDRGDKICTIFTRPAPPPPIFDGKKIVQNFSRCLTTFDFDRKYLRNGLTFPKSEKLLNIYNLSHVVRKKDSVLWSTNKKVIYLNKFTP